MEVRVGPVSLGGVRFMVAISCSYERQVASDAIIGSARSGFGVGREARDSECVVATVVATAAISSG